MIIMIIYEYKVMHGHHGGAETALAFLLQELAVSKHAGGYIKQI
jgi:hypothetical protein